MHSCSLFHFIDSRYWGQTSCALCATPNAFFLSSLFLSSLLFSFLPLPSPLPHLPYSLIKYRRDYKRSPRTHIHTHTHTFRRSMFFNLCTCFVLSFVLYLRMKSTLHCYLNMYLLSRNTVNVHASVNRSKRS